MKVLIVGGGLIGIASAYFLLRRGHEVTLIDRQEGAARETSFANGGLLTPGMSDPWNSPGARRLIFGSLIRSDAPLRLSLKAAPSLVGWGITFLKNSRASVFERNTVSNLRLALYSLDTLASVRHQTGIEYGRVAQGSMKLFRCESRLDHAVGLASCLVKEGLGFRRLCCQEVIEFEPALTPIAKQIAGAIYYATDEIGDAYQFSVGLADYACTQGAQFRFRTEASSLEMRAGRVAAVWCGGERFIADRYVVAAGSFSSLLLSAAGIKVPVRPAKGYSITLEYQQSYGGLRVPIIDDDLHAALVPFGRRLRVAGTAEFAGYERTLQPAPIQRLLKLLQDVLPEVKYDPAKVEPWCGLRPMSADGVPLIGLTCVPNLLVNTGHGHLGWTMAAGSGKLLMELLSNDAPSINPAPYDPRRF